MVASILFCKCGSPAVDVNGWRANDVAKLRCYTCGHQADVCGFTVGRASAPFDVMASAMRDKAVCRVNLNREVG